MVNGDTLTNASVASLVAEHDSYQALATLAVVPNTEPDKYDGLAVDDGGNITGRVLRGSGQPSFHFIGLQVMEAAVLDPSRRTARTRQSPRCIRRSSNSGLGAVRAWRCTAEFLDIGTAADYLQSSLVIAEREGITVDIGTNCRVDPTARLQRTICGTTLLSNPARCCTRPSLPTGSACLQGHHGMV